VPLNGNDCPCLIAGWTDIEQLHNPVEFRWLDIVSSHVKNIA
jgi:hypothetical protein